MQTRFGPVQFHREPDAAGVQARREMKDAGDRSTTQTVNVALELTSEVPVRRSSGGVDVDERVTG